MRQLSGEDGASPRATQHGNLELQSEKNLTKLAPLTEEVYGIHSFIARVAALWGTLNPWGEGAPSGVDTYTTILIPEPCRNLPKSPQEVEDPTSAMRRSPTWRIEAGGSGVQYVLKYD